MKVKYWTYRASYTLAAWSCLACAFGGKVVGAGSGDVLIGWLLIAVGFLLSISAVVLATRAVSGAGG